MANDASETCIRDHKDDDENEDKKDFTVQDERIKEFEMTTQGNCSETPRRFRGGVITASSCDIQLAYIKEPGDQQSFNH